MRIIPAIRSIDLVHARTVRRLMGERTLTMYVITGVSGNTGSHAATALLAAGQPVRVVVRDAKKGEAWKARGAEVAIADVGDAGALAAALVGAKAAYLLLPPPAWGQGGMVADR